MKFYAFPIFRQTVFYFVFTRSSSEKKGTAETFLFSSAADFSSEAHMLLKAL